MRIAGRYEVREHVGSGGLADALAATDLVLGEEVVLKVLRGDRDPALLMREHAALRACSHPNLARVRDFGWAVIDGVRLPFIAMDRVDGPTLDRWAEGRSWDEVRGAILGVARALSALHRAGLRHGDVKPDNVRVAGRAVLLDLSCAAAIGEASDTISGTPRYLAPEVREGRAADGRADLYALGMMWDELPEPGPHAALRAALRSDDLAARPADAGAVIEALGGDVEIGGARTAWVGREAELAAFDAWMSGDGPRVLAFVGAEGAGHTRLMKELLWRVQQRTAATEGFVRRRAEPVRDLLSRALRPIGPGLVAILEAIDELSEGAPHALVLDDAHRLAPDDRRAWERALAHVRGSLSVITTIAADGARVVPLEGLDERALARWIEVACVPHVDARKLHALTAGLPAQVAPRLERAVRGEDWRAPRALDLPANAPREVRDVVALASWLDGLRTGDAAKLGLEPAIADAIRAGWLREEDGVVRAVGTVEGAIDERLIAALEGPAKARALARAGRRDEARALADREWPRDPRRWIAALEEIAETPGDHLRLARAALRAGDARAESELARAEDADPIELALARAEHALKTGRMNDVLALVEAIDDPRAGDLAARALLSQARHAEAAARAAIDTSDPELAARLAETEGLALGYLGMDGDAALIRAADGYRARGDAAGEVRALSCRGILAQRRGDVRAAIALYRQALAIARERGVDDALAMASLNLGTALTEECSFGPAIEAYTQAMRYAAVLGQRGTLASVRFNLANLYIEIGASDRAQPLWAQADADARALGFAHLSAPLARLAGEIAARRGEVEAAERSFASAQAQLSPLDAREVALLRAELALDRGRIADAERHLGAPSEDHASLDRLVRARLALAKKEALDAISSAEDALARTQDPRLAARARSILSEAFRARGAEALAESHARAARETWERIRATLPPELHAAFDAHPHRAQHRPPPSTRLGATSLRRFLAINRRLTSSLDAQQVLEHAMDAAIELTEAERGFVLLSRERTLEVAAARNLDREQVPDSHLKFSRSIAERVIASDEPVVTVDARADDRFKSEQSVHAMRLQSVACVPIRAADGVRGALYLDNRFERGRFSGEDLELLQAFADQVAIALRNAELHAELAAARTALQARVEGQAAKLRDLSIEMEKRQRALEYRYDYARIVGRGAAMRRVLDTLERVIGTDLSVLVRGESGTGKELVARAIHFNGARKDRPLVSLNCAALPEALIESELFGHKRGAFTGADRDAPGLFVEADGGTVFLDELGEMPLGMQAKLLRALEEREVRPVGGTKSVPVDVRLVAATNRDLEQEVKRGRFREDLYYRIGVVTIELPPLRERTEDLADLCTSILRELGEKRLTERAFAALREHRWPGNVRELRNVLSRASVLADGDRIDRDDLGLVVRDLPTDRASFESSEAERIRRALAAAGWNVCAVSRDLGIPRQSLYRKMRQHGLHRPRR